MVGHDVEFFLLLNYCKKIPDFIMTNRVYVPTFLANKVMVHTIAKRFVNR